MAIRAKLYLILILLPLAHCCNIGRLPVVVFLSRHRRRRRRRLSLAERFSRNLDLISVRAGEQSRRQLTTTTTTSTYYLASVASCVIMPIINLPFPVSARFWCTPVVGSGGRSGRHLSGQWSDKEQAKLNLI